MELASERPLEELSADELEALWAQAKRKLALEGAAMIEIRSCQGFDELEACVQLQIETWGYDESDVIPRKTFLVAQTIGGQVIGAFDTEIAPARSPGTADSLVGFVFSLPGVKTGKNHPYAYLHSHMLAVTEALPQPRPGHATQAGTTA